MLANLQRMKIMVQANYLGGVNLNTKGEIGPIGVLIMFLIFIVVWFMFLGGWIGNVGQEAVTSNKLDGVEAFTFSNLNLFVSLILILALIGYMYFSAGR